MQIQKKKVIVGPQDAIGIMLFNTVRVLRSLFSFSWYRPSFIVGGTQTRKNERKEGGGAGSEIKQNNYIYQHITPISAPKIQELIQLLEGASPPFFSPKSFRTTNQKPITQPPAKILLYSLKSSRRYRSARK
jgi:ATP-dependent DNA helicase 2 subunit 1